MVEMKDMKIRLEAKLPTLKRWSKWAELTDALVRHAENNKLLDEFSVYDTGKKATAAYARSIVKRNHPEVIAKTRGTELWVKYPKDAIGDEADPAVHNNCYTSR